MTVSDERLRDLRQWVVKCMNEYTDDDYDDTLAIFDELLALRAASREAALKALTEQAQELGLGYTPQASPAKPLPLCETCGGTFIQRLPSGEKRFIGPPCPDCESLPKSVAKRIAAQKGEPYPYDGSQQGASEAELRALDHVISEQHGRPVAPILRSLRLRLSGGK